MVTKTKNTKAARTTAASAKKSLAKRPPNTRKNSATTRRTQPYTYQCTVFAQHNKNSKPIFCIFAASAGDVLNWADIERLGPGVDGVQRRENVAKRRQITTFLRAEGNTIPTAVIIALDGIKAKPGDAKITIPSSPDGDNKAGLVIDGQHRLLGINDYNPETLIPVVAILNASDVEKAFQFLVVNNKGSRVSQDHIKALALRFQQKDLVSRLVHAKLALDNERLTQVDIINSATGSPFRNRVKFPTTRGSLKKVVPEAFEKALQYIDASRLPKLDDADVQRDFFLAIWSTIVRTWGSGVFSEDCKLTEKVGVITMTRYLVDRLASLADTDAVDLDLSALDDVEEQVENLLKRQTPDFWTTKWIGSGYDTSVGHTKVLDALLTIHRNLKGGREWTEGVGILSKT